MNVGSLFSGIGGIDLGLERASMHVAWQCESDPYRRGILERHWPTIPCYPDCETLAPRDLEPVDVLCGGFPCQDISHAGRRAGITGLKSGLWAEFARLLRGLRPRYVLVENVPGLLSGGLGRVVGDLADCGYDAEWDCIPAAAAGAPHLRARIWILAYPRGHRDAPNDTVFAGRYEPDLRARWPREPDLARVADGVPDRVDRVSALGNACVPQVVEWIGRRMMNERNRTPLPFTTLEEDR